MKKSKKHRYSLKFWHGFYKVLILKKVKNSRDNLDEYIKIIKKNEDNEFGSLELAAGLLKMIREN